MTPDNGFWYQLAYGVTIVTYVAYIASIWWRRRSLRKNR
jgi:heme exporter protein D